MTTEAPEGGRFEGPGQLSNPSRIPVQVRLDEGEVEAVVEKYRAGRTLTQLATEFGVNQRTIATHLERCGVPRRVNLRKMTADDVVEAARRYRTGDSLAIVGAKFGVTASTLRRELLRAGVETRPRRRR